MAQSNSTYQPLPIFNGKTPTEGPKSVTLEFVWSVTQSDVVDLVTLQNQTSLTMVQGLFIDNSVNNGAIVVTVQNTNQQISIGAGYQGYFPVLVGNSAKFIVSTTGSISSKVAFINVPVPFGIWAATAAPAVIANPLPVADAVLDALVVAGRFNVRTVAAANTATDRSVAIAAGGTAQTAAVADTTRKGWQIQNIDGSLTTEEVWYSTTGTAAIGAAGSFALSAYSAPGFPGGAATGSDTGAISVIAATTGHKISIITW